MSETRPSPFDRERQEREATQGQQPPPLTKAQQEAIANAPVVAVPQPAAPTEEVSAEQLAAQQADAIANAPVVAVPAPPESTEDIASVTVVTEQPSGETDVTTIPDESSAPAVPRRK